MAGPGAAAFARAPFLLDLILRQTSDNKEIKLELSAGDDSEIHLVLDCLSDFTVTVKYLKNGNKDKNHKPQLFDTCLNCYSCAAHI